MNKLKNTQGHIMMPISTDVIYTCCRLPKTSQFRGCNFQICDIIS